MEQNNKKTPVIGFTLTAIISLTIGVVLGFMFLSDSKSSRAAIAGNKVKELLTLIDRQYVEHVDVDSLLEESIPDMLSNLDPHTAYIPASDLEQVNTELEGSFSGIGISFQMLNDTITVVEVISGGPSEKVGLLAGDRIVEIDDSIMCGSQVVTDDVMKVLRGTAGTTVKLGIKRTGADNLLSFTVTRGEIPVTSIDASYLIEPEVGYIKLNKFGRNSFSEFYTELSMLRNAGAKDFIVDLRGNVGGYLDIAMLITNEFLDAGLGIVETRGRDGEIIESIVADGYGSSQNGNLAVLIDEYSASASEIFAGAIQDNDRGLIVGRRSFGKGLVQTQETLSDGSAVRITTARYYTPSGRCIQKPFKKGKLDEYAYEIYDRYVSGEVFTADSIKFDTSELYYTLSGREVYGGGGIMPDIFVPADTANITNYYTQVVNAGLMHRFSFEYTDANRARFDVATTAEELLALLPSDDILLRDFVNFAARNKIAARWYYINISRPLILNALKSLIARDVLGTAAYYEIYNTRDNVVNRALSALADARENQKGETR